MIDSPIVCLQVTLLSFILLLCSGKLPLRRCVKTGNMQSAPALLHLRDNGAVGWAERYRQPDPLRETCRLPLCF